MSSKEVRISAELYETLDAARREGESVGDVIARLVSEREEHPLFEIVGLLDDEERERLRERRREFRADLEERMADG